MIDPKNWPRGADGKMLPLAVGGIAGDTGGGDRPESITTDIPGPAISAAPPLPRQRPPMPAPAPAPDTGKAATPPQAPIVPAPAARESDIATMSNEQLLAHLNPGSTQDEIDALHARFDALEVLLKHRFTIATLHARFDHLEAYLKSRFELGE